MLTSGLPCSFQTSTCVSDCSPVQTLPCIQKFTLTRVNASGQFLFRIVSTSGSNSDRRGCRCHRKHMQAPMFGAERGDIRRVLRSAHETVQPTTEPCACVEPQHTALSKHHDQQQHKGSSAACCLSSSFFNEATFPPPTLYTNMFFISSAESLI